MRTGARRLLRSFLWMQRKFTSEQLRVAARTLRVKGMAEMKATSLLLDFTRTPTCHSSFQPGGFRAL